MRHPHRRLFPLAALCLALVMTAPLAAQKRPAEPESKPAASQPRPSKSAPSSKKPTETSAAPKKEHNPREIKVILMDGSIVLGELSIDTIEVKTEFGTLTIPVEKILGITPGLDSHRDLSTKITGLIRDLGDDDYKKRETAQKELLKLGPPVRDVIAEHVKDKNAERQRRAKEIVAKLDEISSNDNSSFFDDGSSNNKKWTRNDTVITPNFTVVGDVSPSVFEVRSKYGPLKIGLNDIRRTEQTGLEKGPTIRQVAVAGTNFHLMRPKNSGVRVKAGDTVSLVATGTLMLTPWGSSARSGPDGATNYGSYSIGGQSAGYGSLVARIGSGPWMKVGSRSKFAARASGVINFGIVMRSTYTRGNYSFPGEYKVRIKVDPKN